MIVCGSIYGELSGIKNHAHQLGSLPVSNEALLISGKQIVLFTFLDQGSQTVKSRKNIETFHKTGPL